MREDSPMVSDERYSDLKRFVPSEEYDSEYYELYYPNSGFLKRELEIRTAKAVEIAQIAQGMSVLDIGCGPGDLVKACAQEGCQVWGVDYSSTAIEIAKARLGAYPVGVRERISLGLMNGKGLGFPSSRFDVAFMTDVVEHLYPEELERALKEAIRVLKQPGRLIIRTAPNAWLVKPIYRMANILLRKGSWDTEFYHVNELSPYSMAATLRKIGAQYKVVMGKVNNDYFFVHLPTIAGPFLRRIARMIDKVLDSSFGEALVFRTPLKFILGTEIWAVVEV